MVCSFFGHRDTPIAIEEFLEKILVDLIENKNVTVFYVGNNGKFDFIVLKILRKLKKEYGDISYNVVLAYMPKRENEYEEFDYAETLFVEGIEFVPKRFAISMRNEWMVKQADYVVAYVKHNFGGAYQFVHKAAINGKAVINIADFL